MTALQEYIDAWLAGDPTRIARSVAPNCTITECYGPVYRGRERVAQWARTWFERGGVVHGWTITDHVVVGDREAAQWTFDHTWGGGREEFDGATLARSHAGLIVELREYRTTDDLYEWQGEWRR